MRILYNNQRVSESVFFGNLSKGGMAVKTIKTLTKLIAAALGASCAGVAAAHSVTIYRQSSAGADAMTDAGWSALAVSEESGKTVDVSGFSVQTGIAGQRYVFFAPHLGRGSDACELRVGPGLFFTEAPQSRIDITALAGVGFDYSGDPVDAAFRVAVKVNGEWFAQAVPTVDSRSNPGPSGAFLTALFAPETLVSKDHWRRVLNAEVGADPLTLGAAPAADLIGKVQSVGLYLENASDHLRFEAFRLQGPLPAIYHDDPIVAAMLRAKAYQEREGRLRFDWLSGTFYSGVFACYEVTGIQEFLDAARAWCASGQWICAAGYPLNADAVCTAQTFLDVYSVDNDPKQIEHIKRVFEQHYFGAETIDKKLLGHALWKEESRPFTGRNLWWWCDALYMAPPVMARLGRATGDARYYTLMHRLFWDTTAYLYSAEERLFFRDKRFFDSKTPSGKPVFWGRGNGWVIGGLVRTIDYIPQDDPMRPKYISLFQDMMQRIVSLQGEDGLWRASLNEPQWFPMKESSGSSFFVFGLAAGINRGWLDRETYLPAAWKGWQGLAGILSPEGKVQWSQPVADRPFATAREDARSYTQGAFLLAASEMYKLNAAD
jgi:rhamnogalacturonyl hydrolase YesR